MHYVNANEVTAARKYMLLVDDECMAGCSETCQRDVLDPQIESKKLKLHFTLTQKQRAERRTVKREKREAAQREAQKAAEAFLQVSPRKAPGRRNQGSVDASSAPASNAVTPPPEVLCLHLGHCTCHIC